jgi:hypothetical protein
MPLTRDLAAKWCDQYVEGTRREMNIVCFQEDGVTFLFDHVSGRSGRVTRQTPSDRVVAVYGVSREVTESRDDTYMRNLMGRDAFARWQRDYNKGHFAALKQGGPYGPNLFPQHADLNPGNRPLPGGRKGREWRKTEKFLQDDPGHFYFVRPLYRGHHTRTWVPSYLEYGVLHWGESRKLAGSRFEIQTFVNWWTVSEVACTGPDTPAGCRSASRPAPCGEGPISGWLARGR